MIARNHTTPKAMTLTLPLTRPSACRLYSALGQTLWIHSIANSTLTDEEKLEALQTFASNLEQEVGIKRLNGIQDVVYCELI